MKRETEYKVHALIEQASDNFYDKNGYEPDYVYINKTYYLHLLREKEDLRSIMGRMAYTLDNRIVMGMKVKLHWRKKIIVRMK
ncbi:MAG: hypothetical protein WC121_11415 [Candidatus Kapaibacterium sp.]